MKKREISQSSGYHRALQIFRENIGYLQVTLFVAGLGGFVAGALVWIFFRDIADIGLIVLAIGAGMIFAGGVISWRVVMQSVLGKRGRYGLNTAIIFVAVLVMAVIVNWLLFWVLARPDPPGWIRVDTTSSKQHLLGEQAVNSLQILEEPVLVTAFFSTDTPQNALAWRITEDLLREFKRRSSTQPFDYRRIDPDLDPNAAIDYGVRRFPALVVEATTSRRREVLTASRDADGSVTPFGEREIITGLLVVNQITQKTVMFITGHGERLVTDLDPSGLSWGFAAADIGRENYLIVEGTVEEMTRLRITDDPNDDPAVIVLAGPSQDISESEEQALSDYLRNGGSMLLTVEPNASVILPRLSSLLLRYGLAISEGAVVDRASSVGGQPGFLQIKDSNGQLPPHPITEGFDVLYLPGSASLGIIEAAAPARVPITEDRVPFITFNPLAFSTLDSWNETGTEISFDSEEDTPGPIPIILSVEAISELGAEPMIVDGERVKTRLLIIGDTDFASNTLVGSARNGDLVVNSINWLAEDFELITIRSKFREPRLLFLTQSERDFIRWSGWLLMPALVGMFGIWTWWRRR